MPPQPTPGRKRLIVRLIILGALVVAASAFLRYFDARQILRDALARVQELGPWAPLVFILLYILACLTFFPGVVLTVGGGVLFGFAQGLLFVSIGATLGAGAAFLLSRYLARGWVLRRFGAHERFRVVDEAVAREGWKIVGLIRLSPAFPYIPLNFVFGLTRIPFWHFLAITWVSILPMTAMFVYLGVLVGDLTKVGTNAGTPSNAKWIITSLGLCSALIVTILVTRLARKALRQRLPAVQQEPSI